MALKIACGPSKLTLGGSAGLASFRATVIPLYVINDVRKSGHLKDCEGPQKYDIKGPNDP